MMGGCDALCVTPNPLESLLMFFPCSQCMLWRTVCNALALRRRMGKNTVRRPRAGSPMDRKTAPWQSETGRHSAPGTAGATHEQER